MSAGCLFADLLERFAEPGSLKIDELEGQEFTFTSIKTGPIEGIVIVRKITSNEESAAPADSVDQLPVRPRSVLYEFVHFNSLFLN